MSTSAAAPTLTLIAPAVARDITPFCEAHLTGLISHTTSHSTPHSAHDATPDPLGIHIAEALEVGSVRPLRAGVALAAAPTDAIQALPATFPAQSAKRLVAAHALLLALSDSPAVRLHHLLMQPTPEVREAEATWARLSATQRKTFDALVHLLRMRAEHAAFAAAFAMSGEPQRSQTLSLPLEVCAVMRTGPATSATSTVPAPVHQRRVVCLVNVSSQEQLVSVDWRAVLGTRHAIRDLVSGVRFNVHGPSLALQPFQVLWATI